MVWGTFFHVCLFDRGGGGLKMFGQCLYRANTFQKGASLRQWGMIWIKFVVFQATFDNVMKS